MVSPFGLQKIILGVVLIGSLFSIIFADDRVFPFSNYPMYSKVFEPVERNVFWSVAAEFEDGTTRRFDTLVGGSAGLRPFWGASFREALLIDLNPEVLKAKLKAVLEWHRKEAARRSFSKADTAKRLMLYRHDVDWRKLVELRLEDASVKHLFQDSTKVILEVQ